MHTSSTGCCWGVLRCTHQQHRLLLGCAALYTPAAHVAETQGGSGPHVDTASQHCQHASPHAPSMQPGTLTSGLPSCAASATMKATGTCCPSRSSKAPMAMKLRVAGTAVVSGSAHHGVATGSRLEPRLDETGAELAQCRAQMAVHWNARTAARGVVPAAHLPSASSSHVKSTSLGRNPYCPDVFVRSCGRQRLGDSTLMCNTL